MPLLNSLSDERAAVGDLLQFLGAHRLLPMAATLAERGLIGDDVAALADQLVSSKPAVSAEQISEERRVLSRLCAGDVGGVAIKGVAIAADVYGEPELRLRCDMDVLVAPTSVDPARATLRELGYRPSWATPSAVPLRQEQWVRVPRSRIGVVDLHWAIRNHPALTNVFDFDEIAAESIELERLGPGVRGAGRSHAVILSALHWFDNRPDDRALVWLFDGERLWRAMDISMQLRTLSLARSRGVAQLVGAYLRQCLHVIRSPIDFEPVEAMLGETGHEASAGLINPGWSGFGYWWFELKSEKGPRNKLRRLHAQILPSREYMRQRFPDGSRLGLVGLHFRRWVAWAASLRGRNSGVRGRR